MKKFFGILGILLLLLAGSLWFFYFRGEKNHPAGPRPVPLTASKHSDAFNRSADSLLDAYYKMTEGFVHADTAAINRYAAQLKWSLDSFKIGELEKDTLLYETALDPLANAKTEVEAILEDPSLEEKKGSLNILSDNLRNLLVIVKYDKAKIYWQECAVAFDDRNPGNWLSPGIEVQNPYLGIHSKYDAGSKEYGGPKDTINFTIADTTKNIK